jgi:enoyl-CoA hydratase/carnithine racemase
MMTMQRLADYQHRFSCLDLSRDRGVLTMRLHTDGGPLRWGAIPHRELPDALAAVGADDANEVVVITGTGDEFSGPAGSADRRPTWTREQWKTVTDEGMRLIRGLLDIPVPMIAAVNGPALRHAEIALLCDIVLAAPHAAFRDSAHFAAGLVPGDGAQLVYHALLGPNRARAFLLTGMSIDAEAALGMGLVAEIVPAARLAERAREIAERLAARPRALRTHTRAAITAPLRSFILPHLEHGFELEGRAAQLDTT